MYWLGARHVTYAMAKPYMFGHTTYTTLYWYAPNKNMFFIDLSEYIRFLYWYSPNIYVFFIDRLRIYAFEKKLICSLSIQLYLCEQDLDVMSRNTYMICINYEVKKLSIFLIIWTNIVPPLQCFLTHKFNVSEMNEFRHALAMFLSHRFMFLIWNERMW